MKKVLSILSVMTIFLCHSDAQTVNWAALRKTDRHIINVRTGLEHGLVYGIGYGYQVSNKGIPVLLNIEYSAPAGKELFDDFKIKTGGQVVLPAFNNFRFSVRAQGIFRRYGNELVNMLNFGSDISGALGYYRKKWFIATDVGFDKAIVTRFKHSEAYKNQYPLVSDGWYEPAAGGNFYYGVQLGFSAKHYDVYVRGGNILNQDFRSSPGLPVYGELGINMRL